MHRLQKPLGCTYRQVSALLVQPLVASSLEHPELVNLSLARAKNFASFSIPRNSRHAIVVPFTIQATEKELCVVDLDLFWPFIIKLNRHSTLLFPSPIIFSENILQ